MLAAAHCVVAASVSSARVCTVQIQISRAVHESWSDEPAEQRLERFRTVWQCIDVRSEKDGRQQSESLLAETSLQAWTCHLCLATTLGLCCLLRDRDHWSTVRFEVVVNMRRAADDSSVREACFFSGVAV